MLKALPALLLLALVVPAAPPESAWETPVAGLSYRRVAYSAPSGTVALVHVFRFSPARFELRVLRPEGARGASVRDMATSAGALLAVNGSFFLEDFSPLGLVVSRGEELAPLRRVDWGIFYVAKAGPGLVHRRDWRAPVGLEFAIEAGPRLVVDGAPLTFKPQRARRTALGVTADGEVVIAVAAGALLTAELAALLAARKPRAGSAAARRSISTAARRRSSSSRTARRGSRSAHRLTSRTPWPSFRVDARCQSPTPSAADVAAGRSSRGMPRRLRRSASSSLLERTAGRSGRRAKRRPSTQRRVSRRAMRASVP